MAECRDEQNSEQNPSPLQEDSEGESIAREKNGSSEHDEESEKKEKLIGEILELQNTLHDLSQRVHNVKEECEGLQADNQVIAHVAISDIYSYCRCWISTYKDW